MSTAAEAPTAAGHVADMRRELAACLHFARGEAPETDSIDAHVRAFLASADLLERLFQSEDADASSDAARLQEEVVALRRELHDKEQQLASHHAQLLRWQETCMSLPAPEVSAVADGRSEPRDNMSG